MKLAALLLCCIAAPLAAQTFPRKIETVSWLQGCWISQTQVRVVEEQWTAPRARVMIGVGRTVRGDSMVEYELVLIRQQDTSLVYEAHPSGQPPATFKATFASDSSVVFENPMHDFPKKVGYRRIGNDSLLAYIEGPRRGNNLRIEFPYARARCAERGGSPAGGARGPRAIIMMRHAEREAYDSRNGPLSPDGHARARSLAQALKDAGITAIYVSAQLRTHQTAAPLAAALRLTPVPVPGSDSVYVRDMSARLRAHGPDDVLLIVGHFNTFPPLLRAMGYAGDLKMEDFEHDDLYVTFPGENAPPTVVRLNFGDASAGAPVLDSTLLETDRRWDDARVRGDTAALAAILAEEFVHTDDRGEVTDRRERLARMAARRGAPVPAGRSDDYRIRRHGAVAVMTHRSTEGSRAFRNSHVFVWRDGRWQAVAHHSSCVSGC